MDNDMTGMMAARPGAASGNSGSGSGDGRGPGVSVGNYKGVMLCNRPFAGLVGTQKGPGQRYGKRIGGDGATPFLPSSQNPNEPMGLNPIRHRPLALDTLDRKKYDCALSKHLRYIRELQQEKKQKQIRDDEQQRLEEGKLARFREKQSQIRAKVIALMGSAHAREEGCREFVDDDEAAHAQRKLESIMERGVGAPKLPPNKAAKGTGTRKAKPAWALTADAAEEKDFEESDELVNYARALDAEEFLEDLEVKAAMEAMRRRIVALKREAEEKESLYEGSGILDGIPQSLLGGDDEEEQCADGAVGEKVSDSDTNADQPGDSVGEGRRSSIGTTSMRQRQQQQQQQQQDKDDPSESNEEDDVVAPPVRRMTGSGVSVADAKSILSTSSIRSLRSVHSTRSIAKLAERALRRMDEGDAHSEGAESKRNDVVLPPPRIIAIVEDGGTRLGKKTTVSNLPYMHRNPAI